ncbi:hypothetical protein ASPZODRAFT_136033 [Penicilliopsis zonata CBS 506.65]|uniref:CENP-V/GFA domain-containing protein n=1 Tax=Penicilliopsis zonata CBS 506.65 TaxID=1073090 RepID=A0A1L9S8U7_9EURO|nr:hypothetical protein ASPZODRAFT_136033 [Penicilliopsis zonata CBS 506.65]OJJ43585.1 hypothetical protein ASPZODRAFT_136033 [Penicilliopsis zonata CBS 506.65]
MPTGSCLCQTVRYQYEGSPVKKALCHCLTCRKLCGSASTNLLIPADKFHLKSGSLKNHHVDHESGMQLTTAFCDTCGVQVYKTGDRPEFEGMIILNAGTVDDAASYNKMAPDAELYMKHRAEWRPPLAYAAQKKTFD